MDTKERTNDLFSSRVTCAALLWLTLAAASAFGQSTFPYSEETPPGPGTTLNAETLAKLPLAENVYSALETTQSEIISDRFNNAGLNVGEDARVGGFLASWSQTSFRIGGIDITDPSGSGAPLLFPELMFWDRLTVATDLMPVDFNPPGLGVTLMPARPAARWTRTVNGSLSGGSLASPTSDGSVPPISRLSEFGYASALVSGPLIANRLGLVAGGGWTRASKLEREVPSTTNSDLASGFAHLVYTPSPDIESRTLAWVQRTSVPFVYQQLFTPDALTSNRAIHVQSTIDRHVKTGLRWQLSGGMTQRSRHNDLDGVAAITADRLTDGPIPSIAAAAGTQSAGRWTLSGRVQQTRLPLGIVEAGASVDRAFLHLSDQFSGTIGELVDNTPARRWSFTGPDQESRRHATTASAFVTDHIDLAPWLTVNAGIRFDSINGHADSGASDVTWRSVLPQASFRWKFDHDPDRVPLTAMVGGYRRSANRLSLDLLAFGDPNAETAIVTRFLSAPLATAAIIDRVGPGTGGNPAFSTIDPNLKRPYTDEYVIGVESLRRWLRVGLTGIARRETNLIAVKDVGVPVTSYSTIGIADPGHDFVSAADDQVLTAYNRLPETYGRNQYVLTNSGEQAATVFGLKCVAQGSTEKLSVLFGATASAANGSAANRGYGPLENDQDVVGELLTDPNAATYARGRLFSDRAFTIKWVTTYQFPKDIRVGVIARYQDGQPFARLVAVPGLNQGAELIRAYPNAGNRFTFTGTLDVRVQKGFVVGSQRIVGVVDFYNLATRSNEVEEYTVTGPNFRTPTAIEPPRSIHVGLRLIL